MHPDRSVALLTCDEPRAPGPPLPPLRRHPLALRTIQRALGTLAEEKAAIEIMLADPKVDERVNDGIRSRGFYRSQVALVRSMLMLKYGDRYRLCDPAKWFRQEGTWARPGFRA